MRKTILSTIVLVIIILSTTIYFSAKLFAKQASYVEVKGLSEKLVKSNIAIWTLNSEIKSNDIDDLYVQVEKNINNIKLFLKESGFEDSEINVAPVNIYQNTYRDSLFRYNVNLSVSVYTQKVDLVRSSSEETRNLIKKGVLLTGNYINFEFTELNSIKPEMLKEATLNARQAAEEFAENSDSSVGKIVRANQGVFSIQEKDPATPEMKKVRIVSTLRFLLK